VVRLRDFVETDTVGDSRSDFALLQQAEQMVKVGDEPFPLLLSKVADTCRSPCPRRLAGVDPVRQCSGRDAGRKNDHH
jgi:hypothetical protein